MAPLAETIVELAAISWFEELGYSHREGSVADKNEEHIGDSLRSLLLTQRLRESLQKNNPTLPEQSIDEAVHKLTQIFLPTLVGANQELHRYLINGIDVECQRADGTFGYQPVQLVNFESPEENDWLVVNQFTVTESGHTRRPDVVVFVNGLPLAVFELKSATVESATIWSAFHQLQTYKKEIPSLFTWNALMVISDGLEARVGTISSDRERFAPWRTVEGEQIAPAGLTQLEVVIRGVFEHRRFLDLLRYFIVFESDGDKTIKKLAGYHQFHAVGRAVQETVRASRTEGNRQIGVIWHTQGSGKSLTMAFYAGKLIQHPAMENPTVVVLTDRNDLDDQLFGTFSRCSALLRQAPAQARDRAHLRELLKVASGGVVFTTIQKFLPEPKGDKEPELSDRNNIVVIADEAHRSQYDFIDGYARHMRAALPQASFIGFTGTPIELADKSTRAVFGNYISIYDIQRAVDDGATVPIFYESRMAKLRLKDEEKPHLDDEFDEATEGEEVEGKEALKTKWTALEPIVGSATRINQIADDLIGHFESRLQAMDGKAMVVCMSRRICVELYKALVARRPDWGDEDDGKGVLKVVMTGSASDKDEWQPHIRGKRRREALAIRFKEPKDPFRIVIVRDMWLTGFDAPCLHTMYIDKPMQGHNLMQAIARVNRVFRDKPGGLVVDYLGLADQLKRALHTYAESGGKGSAKHDQMEAVRLMLKKYEQCRDLFHGFDWTLWTQGLPTQRLTLLPAAQQHILAQDQGKQKLLQFVADLSRTFALSVPHGEAIRIRDDVGFFQSVRTAIVKSTVGEPRATGELEHAIRQIISKALVSEEVIDIFSAAGLKKPNISILSEQFLSEIRDLKHKNLAVELLRKLLSDEIRQQSRRNLVLSRSFLELLENAIRRYQNRSIEAAQVIEELIELAREVRKAGQRGQDLGLTEDEVAFYDALEVNDSAVKVLGDEALKTIAKELVQTVRGNISIDWTMKDSVRARLRVFVKRILRKHGYPPDKQESATKTVLEQAELLSDFWTSTP